MELPDQRPGPLEALAADERKDLVRAAVAELRRAHRHCADWLWAVAGGRKPGALARDAGLEPAAFYRRLHRCRGLLAEILERRGVKP